MIKKKTDMKMADDRREFIGRMDPMVISRGSRHYDVMADIAFELATESAAFRTALPDGISTALADLVRSMNCYYSNLIEGHDTHPIDIERALRNDYLQDMDN